MLNMPIHVCVSYTIIFRLIFTMRSHSHVRETALVIIEEM